MSLEDGARAGGRDARVGDLGSDVAFFLSPPCAWCTGRGEVVEPWPLAARLHLVLVAPPFGLSTADVYRRLTGVTDPGYRPKSGAALMEAVAAGDAEEIGRRLFNRLQAPAVALRPELAGWLARLSAQKPAGCLVSGSGSTVFALARDAADARRIAAALEPDVTAGARVFVVRSLV